MFDWKVIQFTRFVRPELKEWMHAHEHAYAGVIRPMELVLCTPCLALKPLFSKMLEKIETTQAEEEAITHAPPASLVGFYRPVKRGEPYKFTSWITWFSYWLVPSLIWWNAWKLVEKLFSRRSVSIKPP